ncbi:hypothetical protein [Streptomyces sp. CMB-StM0423]|uniref:hypothetical protein n=1 Tax=Streptomyces sp. CMB-StM0423 TaxID=2059884 RepID=UPI000C711AF8|nr:hypothetical protein [Streptomyces sp. CMB-StM0423]AUH40669.1 hypothetical protein CXR04_10770 [Streptomyces sp. CMB-StM0423]
MGDRPTGWTVVGLPGDPVPVELETLRKFRKFCTQREDDAWRASNRTYSLIVRVEEAGLAGDWKKALLGRLAFMHGQLEREGGGYRVAGEALDVFIRAVRPIQERADEALEKARMETGRMSAAMQQVAEYDEQKKTLERRGGRADPWDLRERGRQQESAEEAADRLSRHYRAAQDAKTDFEGLLATFLEELRGALKDYLIRAVRGDVRPPDTMPGGRDPAWWETALHYRDQVKGILDGTLETAAGITAQTLDGATDIGAELTLMMVGMRTPGGPGAAWALAGDRAAVSAYSGSYAFGTYGARSLDEGRLYAKTWIQNTPEGQRPHRPPPPDRGPGRWSDKTRESMSVETAEAQDEGDGGEVAVVVRVRGQAVGQLRGRAPDRREGELFEPDQGGRQVLRVHGEEGDHQGPGGSRSSGRRTGPLRCHGQEDLSDVPRSVR